MLKRLVLFTIFILLMVPFANAKVTISGYVRDAGSGEFLIGANVITENGTRGTISNEYGFYSLSLEEGTYTLVFSYLGYSSRSVSLNVEEDQTLNVELEESPVQLEDVTISTLYTNTNITKLETSTVRLPIQSIRKIPAFMGEVDVIKAIQLLPGVQITSEGSSGFSVRGGGRDQNMVLLDEATVYNPSHMIGLFSVFNNDVVKDVKLYKGDLPASSGGRLASVLDVRIREGNNKKFSFRGGIGTLSSRLTLEGPIVKDKVSFLFAGRRTYADLFLQLSGDETIRQTRLFFHDLNGKINYRINNKNNIYLSGYFGKDVYANDAYAGFNFGNRTLAIRWNHIFGTRLFSNFTLQNSYYFYDLGTTEASPQYVNWKSNLEDYGFKADFNWYITPEHNLKFGASGVVHIIKPGKIVSESQGGINQSAELSQQQSVENGLYISGESKFGERFSVRYGLRYSMFMNVGPATVYGYNDQYQVTDTAVYEKNEIYKIYHAPEPRLGLNYLLGKNQSLKASYSRTIQYLQLAANSSAGTPLEIWFPASPNIKPQVSDQLSAGYFRNFLDNRLQTSVELYYKWMTNSIDFRDHAQLALNPKLEGEIRMGEARSAGAEFFVKYESARFSGWISYTYSRTTRVIPDINDGVAYPSPFDKPHDLAIVSSYNLLPRIAIAANWVYSTGIPYTMPAGRYIVMNNIIPLYTGRNASRFPDYHRLDFSLTLKGKDITGRRWKGDLVISLYNVYARKNVWALNFLEDKSQPYVTYPQATYLFSIVPAITYNFIF